MAISMKKGKAEEGADNIFWTTMSDLLLGLAIIFMTLFVLAMTGFTQDSIQQKQEQIKASQELIEKLKSEGINIDLINARFVKPLDEEMLKLIKDKTIITIEDNVIIS